MPLIFETSGRFPFRTLRLLGWSLITLGVLLLVLDITDVAYTVANFEKNCDEADSLEYINKGWDETPCKHDDHIYAYIATGIWCGLVVIITGIIGARFSKWNIRHLRFQRDLYALMAVLCAVLFIPAVVALHALELKYLKDMGGFYYEDSALKTRDEVKFAVPMVIMMMAGLIFIACVITVGVACCCAPVTDYDDRYRATNHWGTFGKRAPIMGGMAPMPAYMGGMTSGPAYMGGMTSGPAYGGRSHTMGMMRPSQPMPRYAESAPAPMQYNVQRRPNVGLLGPPIYPQPTVMASGAQQMGQPMAVASRGMPGPGMYHLPDHMTIPPVSVPAVTSGYYTTGRSVPMGY